jgi:hypothetical protein
MLARAYVGVVLGCCAVLLSSCGDRPPGSKNGAAVKKAPPAGSQLVTLHVKDMKERLNLF